MSKYTYSYEIYEDPDYCAIIDMEEAMPHGTTMRLRSRKYMSFIDDHELEDLAEDPNFACIWCDVYVHGQMIVSPQGKGPQCRFDTARGGAVLVINLTEYPEYKNMTAHQRYDLVAQCCEIYNAWNSGWAIGYNILDEEGEQVGSCGGYWGFEEDYVREEAEREIAWLVERDRRQDERDALCADGSD